MTDPYVHRLMLINRVCEEFTVDPLRALSIVDDDDEGLVMDLIHARNYMRCKEAYDLPIGDERDKRLLPWQDSEMLREVEENAKGIVEARRPRTGFRKKEQA